MLVNTSSFRVRLIDNNKKNIIIVIIIIIPVTLLLSSKTETEQNILILNMIYMPQNKSNTAS